MEEAMEFEDQEEQEEEMGMAAAAAASYDSLGNSSRVKMPNSGDVMMVAQPMRNNSNSKARYRECLKNHAVGIGGHALDGCGEFLAAGAEGTLDALKCAACNCHRNFHRKETDAIGVGLGDQYLLTHHAHHPHHHQLPQFSAYYRTPAGYLHMAGQQRGPTLALPSTSGADGGGGCGTQSTRDDQEDVFAGGSKKRFRTKFTPEQKEKMLALAERLEWRIQKHDEAVVQEFCSETGVKRQVLKVWMHNNKHTLGKKP